MHLKEYKQIKVEVTSLETKSIINCVTYQKFNIDEPIGKPSPAYKNVIINGAKSLKLPATYIQMLNDIEDNGYCGDIGIELDKSLTHSVSK